MVRRIARRLALLAVLVAVAPAATVARGQDATDPAGTRPLAVAPAVGGQGTTFTIPFESRGVDDRPDDDGELLVVRGPRGTACAGEILGQLRAFGSGPARYSFGPRPARPSFRANAQAYRAVRRWCPGRYTGHIDPSYPGVSGGLRTFTFHVRATPGGPPGRRLPVGVDQDVEPLPPRNPPWMRVRQLFGPDRAIRLDVRIGGRGEQQFDLELRAPFPCSDLAQPEEAFLVFRPGAARVIVGGRGPRIFGRNARRAPAARPLCRGRWIGFFGGTPFRFTVR